MDELIKAALFTGGLAVLLAVVYTIALIVKDSRRYEPNEEEL